LQAYFDTLDGATLADLAAASPEPGWVKAPASRPLKIVRQRTRLVRRSA